jgi:TPP-dependent pyruvate/acetoin dehydrogenase alpha subunit
MPELEVETTKSELMTMYKQMNTMRRMEMAADALYKAKLIPWVLPFGHRPGNASPQLKSTLLKYLS